MRFARFGIFCGAGLTLIGAAGLAQNPSSEAWIISDTDGLRVVYRCDASGNGSVAYDRVDTFPGRCRRSGNNVTIETWGNRAEMTSGQKPVATLRLRVDGETAIGTSSDISGQSFRVDATLLGSRGHTAAQMRQSTRQAENSRTAGSSSNRPVNSAPGRSDGSSDSGSARYASSSNNRARPGFSPSSSGSGSSGIASSTRSTNSQASGGLTLRSTTSGPSAEERAANKRAADEKARRYAA